MQALEEQAKSRRGRGRWSAFRATGPPDPPGTGSRGGVDRIGDTRVSVSEPRGWRPSAPAAAQGAVELDDGGQLLLAQASEQELPLEQVALCVEDLEVAVEPAGVAGRGEARRLAQRFDQKLLLRPLLRGLAVVDERVGDLAQGGVDGLLVADQSVALSC